MAKKEESKKKIRLSVPLSEVIYKRVEEEASLRGISMPTYVAFLIGEHFATYDRVTNKALTDFSNNINQSFQKGDDLAEKMVSESPEQALNLLKTLLSNNIDK